MSAQLAAFKVPATENEPMVRLSRCRSSSRLHGLTRMSSYPMRLGHQSGRLLKRNWPRCNRRCLSRFPVSLMASPYVSLSLHSFHTIFSPLSLSLSTTSMACLGQNRQARKAARPFRPCQAPLHIPRSRRGHHRECYRRCARR